MKKMVLLVLILTFGCSSAPKSPRVHISLINNNTSIKFQGLDGAVLGEIQRGAGPEVWQALIPVYRMPADTDLKDYQPPQPGIYRLQDSVVVFTPDTSFIKGRTYFMRYYHFGEGKTVFDMIKNKRKLGSQPYTDLAF